MSTRKLKVPKSISSTSSIRNAPRPDARLSAYQNVKVHHEERRSLKRSRDTFSQDVLGIASSDVHRPSTNKRRSGGNMSGHAVLNIGIPALSAKTKTKVNYTISEDLSGEAAKRKKYTSLMDSSDKVDKLSSDKGRREMGSRQRTSLSPEVVTVASDLDRPRHFILTNLESEGPWDGWRVNFSREERVDVIEYLATFLQPPNFSGILKRSAEAALDLEKKAFADASSLESYRRRIERRQWKI